jgi:hypothetical protein
LNNICVQERSKQKVAVGAEDQLPSSTLNQTYVFQQLAVGVNMLHAQLEQVVYLLINFELDSV